MAGSVTGSIGSNDVLLKNMATEETLYQILEVLESSTVTPGTPAQKKKDDKAAADASTANTKNLKRTSQALEGLYNGIEGIGRVIRGLDSNVNNASYAFQAMSRGSGVFSKAMEFAANSISQLQEQFNAYGKMMQIGGVVTGDFGNLSKQAIELGTDLQGLVKLSTEYGASLKSGSSSVAATLDGMRTQFKDLTSEQKYEYGRMGVGINQITEQMLLTAESQGGYNAVLAKYKGSTTDMNKGMLKSTQELNIFASAIGMNSRMMQEEGAKAAQKIENKVFMANLSDAEKNQVAALQGLTGSFETALSVVRSFKTGFVDEQAASFLATQGIAGLGKEVKNLMELLGKGKGLPEALTESGLISAANKVDPKTMEQMSLQIKAYASGGNAEAALGLANFLTLINSLRGTKATDLTDKMKDFKDKLDPDGKVKTIDSFTELLQEQNTLAKSTAYLNTQLNRLGLTFALAGMKSTNAIIGAGKIGIEDIKTMFAGMGIIVPPDALSDWNSILEGKIQGDVVGKMQKFLEDVRAKENGTKTNPQEPKSVVTLSGAGINKDTTMPVKVGYGPNARIEHFNAAEMVDNKDDVWSKTNALAGKNNKAGMVALAALVTNKVKTVSALTAGSDLEHAGKGEHGAGNALDFGLANVAGQKLEDTGKQTFQAIQRVLKEYGINPEDYHMIDETIQPTGDAGKHWTGPHIHLQLKNEKVIDQIREQFKSMMKTPDKTGALDPNKRDLDGTGAVTQMATDTITPVKGSQASVGDLVNTDNRDNIVVTALENLVTRFEYKIDYLASQIDGSLERHS